MTKYQKFWLIPKTCISMPIALFMPRACYVYSVHKTCIVVHGPNKYDMDFFWNQCIISELEKESKVPFLLLIFGHLSKIWPFSCFLKKSHVTVLLQMKQKRVLKYKFCWNISYYVHSSINDHGGVTKKIFLNFFKKDTFVSKSHPNWIWLHWDLGFRLNDLYCQQGDFKKKHLKRLQRTRCSEIISQVNFL